MDKRDEGSRKGADTQRKKKKSQMGAKKRRFTRDGEVRETGQGTSGCGLAGEGKMGCFGGG
jgi:hypothetical protein